MKIKALVSFAGAFSMYVGEERECNNDVILSDLLKAGYVEEVKTEKVEDSQKEDKQEETEIEKVEDSSKKGVKNESKRNNNKKSS